MYFSLFFPLSTPKNPGHYKKINIRRHSKVDRRQTGQGSWYPKEKHGGEFPSSFCPTYTVLRAEEAGNREMPIDTKKKREKKSLLSLAKGPGKEQPSKTENLQIVTSLILVKYYQNPFKNKSKKTGAPLPRIKQRPSNESGFVSSLGARTFISAR